MKNKKGAAVWPFQEMGGWTIALILLVLAVIAICIYKAPQIAAALSKAYEYVRFRGW